MGGREGRGDPVPARMRLGKAVQKHDRRSVAAEACVNASRVRVGPVLGEAGEEGVIQINDSLLLDCGGGAGRRAPEPSYPTKWVWVSARTWST